MVLNERDKKGNTALHMAIRKARSEIVSFLLSYASMNVNAINNQQETANETMELKRAESDIKHEVQSQLIQNEKTCKRLPGQYRKLQSEAGKSMNLVE
ncbi:ankyrin repeat-containing protein [Trifolium pratense]|uniref:Ankyrin repeat-containing protein n=1 Tax=Trifolium pratense TaxID=57577 RepID=A0A2K3LZH8_TRIPR|nr:ankyrin repeat-containing protein [Trifolium pratense]